MPPARPRARQAAVQGTDQRRSRCHGVHRAEDGRGAELRHGGPGPEHLSGDLATGARQLALHERPHLEGHCAQELGGRRTLPRPMRRRPPLTPTTTAPKAWWSRVVTWQVFLVDYVVHARHLEHYGRTFAARHRAQPTSSRYACRTAEHVAELQPAMAVELVAARPTTQGNRPPTRGAVAAPPQCYGRPQPHDVVHELAAELMNRAIENRAPVRLPCRWRTAAGLERRPRRSCSGCAGAVGLDHGGWPTGGLTQRGRSDMGR